MTATALSRPHIARTFAALDRAITYVDGSVWPRIPLPKRQLHAEFAVQMRILREIKQALAEAVRSGDEKRIVLCRRARVEQMVAVHVARARWHNPKTYLCALA